MQLPRSFLFLLFFFGSLFGEDPDILYLTWKGDPATTMVVMWHTTEIQMPTTVYYQPLNGSGWEKKEGSSYRLKQSSVVIHQVELTDLSPDTEYVFHLEGGENKRFLTMPQNLSRPLRIVVGGDAYFSYDLNHKMNVEVASKSPDFVIMAGDIAYTEGLRTALRTRFWRINRWQVFFRSWSADMVTKEGRLIPIVPVIGNHDSKEGFDDPYKKEVLFYRFFTFPEPEIPYWLFKVSEKLCFYLLDSGHTYPIGGRQREWLESALKKESGAYYHIPVYHIGAYPSETSYTHRGAKDIRKFWVPLFEKYGVKISMEHDNHTFKRTYPIWEGAVHPKGITYLGDGSWGVPPVKPNPDWYLAKILRTNCYWLLTVNPQQLQAEAFDNDGVLIDELRISAQ